MLPARQILLALFLLPLIASLAPAQGLLVVEATESRIRLPRPWVRPPQPAPGSYKVESISVDANLKGQIATVQVAQTFRNTGSRQMEASFVFPLPYDGAIDRLTLMVDGKEFEAKLLPAGKARELYESIVRKNEDPALLEWVGTGLFRTSVFPLPAGAERTVTLRYTQLCRQSNGLTDFLFPLKAAKYTSEPLEKLKIRVAVESSDPITSVYSPSSQIKVERPSAARAVVTHELSKTLPGDDFRLFVDAGTKGLGASLVSYRPNASEPGYFMLLASPPLKAADEKTVAKTMLFVVDRSGSMSGAKIEQARGALRFVLNNLRDGDTFNIIAYDTDVQTFRPELQKVDEETRQAALAFVDGLAAGGSTNIDGALTRALGMLEDSSRPNYVMFLTDGLPTAGDTSEASIVARTKQHNNVRARLFAFGVGYDVNSRLLDKLARANFGQSEYVRPNEDIEASVSRLYNRIGTPVLTDVQLAIEVDASAGSDAISRVYPNGPFDLFAGDQVVMVGRYGKAGAAKVKLSGTVEGKQQSFDFPAELVADSDDSSNAFIGRLWAQRRVGEIIDEIDLKGKNDELIKELVDLATTHGVITQYTSFLADETADHNAVASNRMQAEGQSLQLGETSGRFAFQQRASKLRLQKSASPAAAIPAPADAAGGGGFGGGISMSDSLRLYAAGCPTYYDARGDKTCVADNIRQVGGKTFFLRNANGDSKLWCDSTVNAEEEKSAKQIERFSDAYFDLVAKHGKDIAPYMAVEETVVVRIGDEVYQW